MIKWDRVFREAVVLLMLVCLALAAWHSMNAEKEEGDTIKIGVAVYQEKDIFLASIMENLKSVIHQHEETTGESIKLDIADGQGNQIIQNEQVEKYINLNYDVICVNLVDRTNAAAIIEQTAKANIPIIFFNREPVEEDMYLRDNIYYIGSDARESAELQAEIILDFYKKDQHNLDQNQNGVIEYAMLEGEQGHQDATIRTEYSVETLKKQGMLMRKVQGGIANFSRSQAAALTEKWFTDPDNQIELIISNNDDMALGAIDAMEKLEIPKDSVKVVGIDGVPQALQAVDQGKMMGTVVSDAKLYADALYKTAYNLVERTSISSLPGMDSGRYFWIPWEKYTKKE